jgi:hypothetical protein
MTDRDSLGPLAMSEEGTADRPVLRERVEARSSTRSAGIRVDSAAPEPAQPLVDVSSLLRRLAGKPAAEVLARLSGGDPLRLYPLCARRIREGFFVLDPERVFERALAMVAVGIEIEGEACTRPEWLTHTLDRAIARTLEQDREEERAGLPPEDPEQRFALFIEVFFLEPPLARLAAVRLNGLEERVRKAFQLLLVEGRPLEECLELGLGPPERLQADILEALEAIGLIDEHGFGEPGREEENR